MNSLEASLRYDPRHPSQGCHWLRGAAEDRELLAPWPLPRCPHWLDHVNAPQTPAEVQAIQRSLERDSPFGSDAWNDRAIRRLGLESTVRPRGRPKKVGS